MSTGLCIALFAIRTYSKWLSLQSFCKAVCKSNSISVKLHLIVKKNQEDCGKCYLFKFS